MFLDESLSQSVSVKRRLQTGGKTQTEGKTSRVWIADCHLSANTNSQIKPLDNYIEVEYKD